MEVEAQGVVRKRRADAGADVGGGIQFERRAPRFQFRDETWVLDGRERMTDAFGANGEGFADGFRPGGFAGMVGEAKPRLACLGIHLSEGFRTGLALVTTKADADDGGIHRPHLGGFAKDDSRLFYGEMAHGVEDPVTG